jgi:hypothetical protein
MNLFRTCTFVLLLLNFRVFGQTAPTGASAILRSNVSDTVFTHLQMNGANYDGTKNNLPYYVISQPTSYDQSANPSLIVKKTQLVSESNASVIKKYFSKYITSEFVLEKIASLTRNENLNQYKLFPFRINSSNQLEELTDYGVNWQTFKNNNLAARGAAAFKSSSVLANGNWYKIGITQTGIHKLTKSFFSSIGINPGTMDPTKLRVFGNGGKMLPELNSDQRLDDLEENAIQIVTADDGSFDYALFYATGPTEWKRTYTTKTTKLKFSAIKNLYSDTSFYFITLDAGTGTAKRIAKIPSSSQTPNVTSNSYDYYNYHEENTINFAKSGRSFYGEYFDLTTSYRFAWSDADFVIDDSLITEVSLVALASTVSYFQVSDGRGLNFTMSTGPVDIGNTYADYAEDTVKTGWGYNKNNSEIGITITKLSAKSLGWLDKVTINTRRSLNLRNRQFCFRDTRVMGKICRYSITVPSSSGLSLWDVSDPLNPVEQGFIDNGSAIDFVSDSKIGEFCVSPSNDFYTPVYFGKVPNQNLHSIAQADFIIVTHPLFIKEAERLGMFHLKNDTLTYAIATVDQIYNEFSSGRQDISAIRDFIRMIYTRNISDPTKALRYVLLMGDGSYNNKTRSLVNNSNLVPTYQSHISLSSTSSIATDDFYGLMDPDEGYLAESHGKIDLGIGRFTCRTVNEVRAVLAKIENYYRKDPAFTITNTTNTENCNTSNESPLGDWRNWLLFLGDDEDGALHMRQSDQLSTMLKSIAPNYNFDKILLDSYQRFSTQGGNRYPDASEDFSRRIKKGALIFNYTGHGGEVGLTAERMIDIDIINNLDNFNKLPLFITATCEFSRYDDPARTSAGELCLLNPHGAAIGLFTTCRLAFAEQNFMLNSDLLAFLFQKMSNGKWPALGDAIRLTKSHPLSGQTFYNANFHLLGDPAMKLAYPSQKVMTSKINNSTVGVTSVDTLAALAKITISGYVADNAGNKRTDFNGLIYPTVFDKEQVVTCLMNTPASARNYQSNDPDSLLQPFKFKMQKNILYRGKTLVTNGDFSFTFIVPKDISFAVGPGKISYYATDGNLDATGYYSQVVVGGEAKNAIVDNTGPQVNLFLNDKSFVNGGLTNEKPVLYADLTDSSGINTVGTGIGHDISVVMDENTSKPVILNDYYEANLNSYQSGRVRYPYTELSEGTHRLSFKVWDIQNNSNTVYTDFIVAKSAELALKHVLNYPNPFTTKTKFIFEHNQACDPLKVTIQVYTVSGKIVKTIQKTVTCEGFSPEGIEWDGRDDYGDKLARGVYIYKLAILNVENKKAEKIEKLVILN